MTIAPDTQFHPTARKQRQPKPRMGGKVTNWKDLSCSDWCPMCWERVGKMIMNYQISLKAKKKYATISFSRRSAQFGQWF